MYGRSAYRREAMLGGRGEGGGMICLALTEDYIGCGPMKDSDTKLRYSVSPTHCWLKEPWVGS